MSILDEHVLGLDHVEHVAPVRVVDHATLRWPGGAGGVDVGRDIRRLDGGHALFEVLVRPCPALLTKRLAALKA